MKRIAVVESSDLFRERLIGYIGNHVKPYGFSIEGYDDGETFFEERKSGEPFDLITMDIFGKNDNMEILKRMRKNGYTDPVFIISFNSAGYEDFAKKHGAEIIEKGEITEELEPMLDKALALE
jgi:DNA-binding response OmpR family regulator